MADLIGFIGDVFAMEIGTLGTVTVTLGLVLAGALIVGLALIVFRRLKRG